MGLEAMKRMFGLIAGLLGLRAIASDEKALAAQAYNQQLEIEALQEAVRELANDRLTPTQRRDLLAKVNAANKLR
jgi:hypothetical protein